MNELLIEQIRYETRPERDVVCLVCGNPFITEELPDKCCSGKDCACGGEDLKEYECENCKEKKMEDHRRNTLGNSDDR